MGEQELRRVEVTIMEGEEEAKEWESERTVWTEGQLKLFSQKKLMDSLSLGLEPLGLVGQGGARLCLGYVGVCLKKKKRLHIS